MSQQRQRDVAPDTGPGPLTRPSGQLDHLADLYRQMLLIRRVEEESARAYAMGKIGGTAAGIVGAAAVAHAAVSAVKRARQKGGENS